MQASKRRTAPPPAHLLPLLNELKRGFAELYGERLAQVLLYGSQARGSANEDSDIDVLVVLKDDVDPAAEIGRGSQVSAALSLKYDTLVSTVYLSEATFRLGQDTFARNLREEGMAL